jgi:hypothetical protein
MEKQTVYEASLRPESLRFKQCSERTLAGLYRRKKRKVEALGGHVSERDGPLIYFPLWVRVAFLDEFIQSSRPPGAPGDREKSGKL